MEINYVGCLSCGCRLLSCLFVELAQQFSCFFCNFSNVHLSMFYILGAGVGYNEYFSDAGVSSYLACHSEPAENGYICAILCLNQPECVGFSYNSSVLWEDNSCFLCGSDCSGVSVNITVFTSINRLPATNNTGWCV